MHSVLKVESEDNWRRLDYVLDNSQSRWDKQQLDEVTTSDGGVTEFQHVLFAGCIFKVNDHVLTPKAGSEVLVEAAVEVLE